VSGLSVLVSAWTVGHSIGSVATHLDLLPLAFQSALSAICGTDKLTLSCDYSPRGLWSGRPILLP